MPSERETTARSPSRRRLVLATFNRGKVAEFADLLTDVPFDVLTLADVPGASPPEETGTSYRENALLKARAGVRYAKTVVLADDSGIEVDALGGAPGVHSARYGGRGLDDAGRRRRLLEALRGVPSSARTAHFRCVIAIADPEGNEHVVEGSADGVILDAPRGTGGFGYDPLFFYPPLGRTFAELAPEEKARVSHRGLAAQAAVRVLRECYTPTADR